MPGLEVLLAILGALILGNLILLAFAIRWRRLERDRHAPVPRARATPATPATPASRAGLGERAPRARPTELDAGDARAAAAVEAFVAEVAADAGGRTRAPAAADVLARRASGADTLPSDVVEATRTPRDRPAASPGPMSVAATARRVPEPQPELTLAGLTDPATWDRSVRDESARGARFGRPMTVVMAELTHLDEVAGQLGRDAADRVVAGTARLLVSHGRAIDRIAWFGDARFGVLLLETGEGMASGYIDRVRTVADGWLQASGLSVRLSLGWASPEEGRDIVAATALARERMERSEGQAILRP